MNPIFYNRRKDCKETFDYFSRYGVISLLNENIFGRIVQPITVLVSYASLPVWIPAIP